MHSFHIIQISFKLTYLIQTIAYAEYEKVRESGEGGDVSDIDVEDMQSYSTIHPGTGNLLYVPLYRPTTNRVPGKSRNRTPPPSLENFPF